ncbi:MAG: hypothetical protein F4Z40_00910 [Chloroflexi bacterium]|nr:hypothetical protein [Chloroflexota bacterium]
MTCIERIRYAMESEEGWDRTKLFPCAHCHLLMAAMFGATNVLDFVSLKDARKRYPCLLPATKR